VASHGYHRGDHEPGNHDSEHNIIEGCHGIAAKKKAVKAASKFLLGSVTSPPAPVSVVAMVVARIVGVVAMVVAMMIAVVAMMVAVAVPVPGCGWDHAADRDCTNNA
jgi:hypothetical protein